METGEQTNSERVFHRTGLSNPDYSVFTKGLIQQSKDPGTAIDQIVKVLDSDTVYTRT